MSVHSLPRRYGPALPKHVLRRVKYRRRAEISTLPVLQVVNPKARAHELYQWASKLDEIDVDAAIPVYQQAIALDPNHALAYTNLGNCFYQKGRLDLAERAYMAALWANPEQPEALYNLGYFAYEKGDYEQAVELFEETVVYDPKFPDAWYNLGLALERKLGTSRAPAVRRAFTHYLKLVPEGDWADRARERCAV